MLFGIYSVGRASGAGTTRFLFLVVIGCGIILIMKKVILLSVLVIMLALLLGAGIRFEIIKWEENKTSKVISQPRGEHLLITRRIDPALLQQAIVRGEKVKTLTGDFFAKRKKGASIAELKPIAEKRKEEMKFLIRNAPEVFLQRVASNGELKEVPSELQPYFELPVVIKKGVLEVMITENFEQGVSEEDYFIQDEGERYNFYPAGVLPSLLSGTTVNINGYRLDDDLTVDVGSGDATKQKSAKADGQNNHNRQSAALVKSVQATEDDFEVVEKAEPEALGAQKVAVILVKSKDVDIETLPTSEEVKDRIFGPLFIQAFFKEASYGKMWLEGNVYGWYNLPQNVQYKSGADFYTVFTAAVSLADIEIDFREYDRVVVIEGGNRVAESGGTAFVGKALVVTGEGSLPLSTAIIVTEDKKSFLQESFSIVDIRLAHELIHGFGLKHANALECGEEVFKDNCEHLEYGNKFDVMGYLGYALHPNARSKDFLGWLAVNNGSVLTLDPGKVGDYILKPLEMSGAVVARINISSEKTFYLEYRKSTGFDEHGENAYQSFPADQKDGLFVNWWDGEEIRILDTSPGNGGIAADDWGYIAVLPNNSFFDADVKITNLGEQDGGLSFRLEKICKKRIWITRLNALPANVFKVDFTSGVKTIRVPIEFLIENSSPCEGIYEIVNVSVTDQNNLISVQPTFSQMKDIKVPAYTSFPLTLFADVYLKGEDKLPTFPDPGPAFVSFTVRDISDPTIKEDTYASVALVDTVNDLGWDFEPLGIKVSKIDENNNVIPVDLGEIIQGDRILFRAGVRNNTRDQTKTKGVEFPVKWTLTDTSGGVFALVDYKHPKLPIGEDTSKLPLGFHFQDEKSLSGDDKKLKKLVDASVFEWNVPPKVPPGEYIARYEVDTANKVSEFNEGNNKTERRLLFSLKKEEGTKQSSDADASGVVDILDILRVAENFGKEGDNLTGDVNGDKKVDIFDLTLVGQNWTKK